MFSGGLGPKGWSASDWSLGEGVDVAAETSDSVDSFSTASQYLQRLERLRSYQRSGGQAQVSTLFVR